MGTKFEQANADFSDLAHIASQSQIYPYIFPQPSVLSFESTSLNMGERQRVLDGEMGIDRIISISNGFNGPIKFTIQERFRRKEYSSYKDITITEWNHATNQPSELHKLHSNLFVYGYYDEKVDFFYDWIVINTSNLVRSIINKEINYQRRRNKKDQTFLTITFAEMNKTGGIIVDNMGSHFLFNPTNK